MTNRASLGEVYDKLKQEGHIVDEHNPNDAQFNSHNDSPWFIQGLMGCGGWIAAVFMLGVVGSCIGTFLANLNQMGVGLFLVVVGSFFTIGTAFSARNEERGIFATQVSLTIHIAGHVLLVIGFVMAFEMWRTDTQIVITAIYTILLQLVFIVIHPNAIYRFLAMLVICYCLASIAFVYSLPILTSIGTVVLMIIGIVIWTDKLPVEWQINRFAMLQPIGYGAIMGAFGLMIYEVSNRYYYYSEIPSSTAYITALLLLGCLIWVEIQLLREYQIRLTAPFAIAIFAISVIVSLPVVTTPGILAAIVAILLAFRRRNRVLLGISYVYLGGFIIYYYYWLEVSLLTKSIILMVTGILLIAARLILRRIVIVPDEKKGLSA